MNESQQDSMSHSAAMIHWSARGEVRTDVSLNWYRLMAHIVRDDVLFIVLDQDTLNQHKGKQHIL